MCARIVCVCFQVQNAIAPRGDAIFFQNGFMILLLIERLFKVHSYNLLLEITKIHLKIRSRYFEMQQKFVTTANISQYAVAFFNENQKNPRDMLIFQSK